GYFGNIGSDGLTPPQRLTKEGYPWVTTGESLTAGVTLFNPEDALRTLIIDAGVAGMTDRNHLLSIAPNLKTVDQVGVGIVLNGGGPLTNYYTIDTGVTGAGSTFLTGVVYNDLNHNGKYDVGE